MPAAPGPQRATATGSATSNTVSLVEATTFTFYIQYFSNKLVSCPGAGREWRVPHQSEPRVHRVLDGRCVLPAVRADDGRIRQGVPRFYLPFALMTVVYAKVFRGSTCRSR